MDDYLAWQIRVYGRGSGGGVQRQAPQVATRKRITAAQLGRCLYCELPIGTRVKRNGKTVALTAQWDHFVPFSYLAQNPDANWVMACQVCNNIKSDRMFKTVEEARAVILRVRDEKGYEAVKETVAKLKARKPGRAKTAAKPKPKPRAKKKPAPRGVPAPRKTVTRTLPIGAVSHSCGAWWTGDRRAHCAGCCHTFANDRVALLHRTGEGAERRCLQPQEIGLIPVEQPWGTCWEKPKGWVAQPVVDTVPPPRTRKCVDPDPGDRWKPTRTSAHRKAKSTGRGAFTPEQRAIADELQARAVALRESSEEGLSIEEAIELAAVQISLAPRRPTQT
jgi:hypothetical protein